VRPPLPPLLLQSKPRLTKQRQQQLHSRPRQMLLLRRPQRLAGRLGRCAGCGQVDLPGRCLARLGMQQQEARRLTWLPRSSSCSTCCITRPATRLRQQHRQALLLLQEAQVLLLLVLLVLALPTIVLKC
jgi:hypothetical protein